MEKNKKLKTGLIVIGTLLIGGGLLFGPSVLAGAENTADPQTTEKPVYSVKSAEVIKQTLNACLDVNGDIVSAQQVDVFPDVSGKLVSVRVALGSYVRKGELIAEVDPSRPGTTYMNSPVYAPISGIVCKMPLSSGITVSANTSITAISGNENLEIHARIPEREIAGLTNGLKAEVSLQAYPGELFTATVTQVSPILDSVSRTKLVTLKFDLNDSRINAGMFARLKINTRSYQNVITVPAEAVINSHGTDTVYVIQNQAGIPTAIKKEVSRGVTLQGWTEIKSGLNENETVIVQGQQLLNGGESLRIISQLVAVGEKNK